MSEVTRNVVVANYPEHGMPNSVWNLAINSMKYFASASVTCGGYEYEFEPDQILVFTDEYSYGKQIDPDDDYTTEVDEKKQNDISHINRPRTVVARLDFGGTEVIVKVSYSLRNNQMFVSSASMNREAANKAINVLIDTTVEAKIEKDEVSVNFWVCTPNGPNNTVRNLVVPEWREISLNYNKDVAAEYLDSFDRLKNPAAGRILIWHGPPGTGKTYAIRAMMDRLDKEFEFHYIVDPEIFFNAEPAYMLQVLMGGNRYGAETKKRLFILEDTGELLRSDAKVRTGQGLSRLLNFTDGLIGQGMEIYILITTNEPIKEIHPAVIRHGRCLSVIEFTELTIQEANFWLREHESDLKVDRPVPVSELYAMKNDYMHGKKKEQIPVGQYV